jgi:hypothetical protein
MTKEELWGTIRELQDALARVDSKYKMLRRRAHIHRGDITGAQADQLRALLRGHKIDAAEALSLHPEDFFDLNGELDGGAVLWWLKSAGAKGTG